MKEFQRILFATDLSPASEPAFERAIAIAKESGAELLIAHASQGVPVALNYVPPEVFYDWEEKIRDEVAKRLAPLVAAARGAGVDARALVGIGFADDVLVDLASEQNADLLLMGTHGRQGAGRLFLGSVAARVIARAPCPVMTVRVARPQAA